MSLTDTMNVVYERLNGQGIDYAFVGSANLLLQGMETDPRDLDVVVPHKQLDRVRGLFSDYAVSSISPMKTYTGERTWEMKAVVNGTEVQFFGGDGDDTYVSKLLAGKIVQVKLGDVTIPCFTLDAEMDAYRKTGRERKALLIEEFLRRNGGRRL